MSWWVERVRGVRRGGSDYLLRGLIWLGVGIALSASDSFFGTGNRMFGWIAAAVGVAYLIYYGLEGRREGPPPGSGGPPLACKEDRVPRGQCRAIN